MAFTRSIKRITSTKNKLDCAYCHRDITNKEWTYYGKNKVCLSCKKELKK